MLDKVNRKRLNTQILTKTQVALQVIKKYEMEQSRVNFKLNPMNESNILVNELDYNYSRMNSHRLLTLDKKYKISLFTYSQQYYCLEMINYIFPMRVIIRNVKNEGTIFIGYDQQYPGICQNTGDNPFSQHLSKQKNYDFKSVINQDMIIVLKNKGNKMVKNVYFTWIAGKSLFLCDFKVQFLGFVREVRVMSQVKLKNDHKLQNQKQKNKANSSIPEIKRTKTESKHQQLSELSKQFVRSKLFSRELSEKPILIQELNVFNRLQSNRHNSRQNLAGDNRTNKLTIDQTNHTLDMNRANTTFLSKNNLGSLKEIKAGKTALKSDVDFKILQAQRNRVMFEQFKVKQKQLRELASRCKRMIQTQKKYFNEQSVRRQRLNKDLAIVLYSAIFLKHSHRMADYQVKKQNNKFRLGYLCSKFIRKLKKSHQNTCNMVHYKSKRTAIEGTSGIILLTKSVARQSTIKAQRVIKQTFEFLNPLFLIKYSIFLSGSYRQSIRLIQRTWKQKYHNRIACLLYFIDNHLEKMYLEFPHLQLFHQMFYKEKVNRKISLDYIQDESQKFRVHHQAYLRRLEEIEQINKMNMNNQMTKSSKKKLIVPRRPIRPMHRFYRNLDIMRSMVRTWFEIQYKKYMKKSGKKIKN